MAIKFLVEVYLPASQKSFDMRIPASSRMGEITTLVASIASDLSGGSFKAISQSMLIDAENGRIFDVNMTALEQGIRNGTKLILI